MAGFQDLVEFIRNGENVDAGVTNRPIRQIAGNANYLKSVIDLILAGETLIAMGRTVKSDVQAGQPVYFNPNTLQFEKALAVATTDEITGGLVTATSSQVWGIVLAKTNATKADILLRGIAEVDLSASVDDAVVASTYYLSGTEAGKLQATRPPVAVRVLQVSQPGTTLGTHEVYVNTQFVDHLEQHNHVKFRLESVPAGDHTPPTVGMQHTITNPDVNVEGWLPAAHASFGGKAPADAKFGYNLSASDLGDIWPPIPVENSVLQMFRSSTFGDIKGTQWHFTHDFPSMAAHTTAEQTFAAEGVRTTDGVFVSAEVQLPANTVVSAYIATDDVITIRISNTSTGSVDPLSTLWHVTTFPDTQRDDLSVRIPQLAEVPQPEYVTINRDGIWWMSDCYNEAPWPTDLDTANPTSASITTDCPIDIETVIMELWYSHSLFFSTNFGVLSLSAREGSGIQVFCSGTNDEKSVGHLELDLDLSLAIQDDDQAGHQVVKTIDGSQFIRGPVAESVRSASPELLITSDVADIGANGERYGNLLFTANLDINGSDFPVDTVRLDGVEEEFFEDIMALNFGQGLASEFRGRILVPTRLTLPAGTMMKLRFWVMGRVTGNLGASVFPMSYRILPRPTAVLTDAVALPLADSVLDMTTTATFTSANEYVEMESDEFAVSSGDEIQFTMSRTPPDGYAGDLFLLRKEGVLVAGP